MTRERQDPLSWTLPGHRHRIKKERSLSVQALTDKVGVLPALVGPVLVGSSGTA